MTRPIERCLDLDPALELIQDVLRSRGIRWSVSQSGESAHAATCTLVDRSGRMLARGHGKGDEFSSYVGAVYEAAEHYWSDIKTCDPSRVVYERAHDFCRDHAALNNFVPAGLLEASPDAPMAFRMYAGVTSATSSLYPVGLSTPSYIESLASGEIANSLDGFDYRYLARYSSNSGVAIGANRTEAVTHGLLECVERDAVSRFLTDVFLARKSAALRVIDQASLPSDLRDLIGRVEKECRQNLILFELENRFGIPVFCSILDGEAILVTAGYGASLSRHHAAARSIHEVAQVFLIKTGDGWNDRHDERVLDRLAGHRFHTRCAKFDLARECTSGCLVVSYYDTAAIDYPVMVEDYLTCVGETLDRHGATAFASDLITFENGVTVSHSFFVGQDYFFLVGDGNLVFPPAASIAAAESLH